MTQQELFATVHSGTAAVAAAAAIHAAITSPSDAKRSNVAVSA